MPSIIVIFKSLIIPYFVYNIIGLVYLIVADQSLQPLWSHWQSTLLVADSISGPVWFFVALAWLKFATLFLKQKRDYLILSMVCIGLIFIIDAFLPKFQYQNIFMLKTSILAFPFYAFGVFAKSRINTILPTSFRVLFILLALAFTYYATLTWGGMDLSRARYTNLLLLYSVAILASVAILFLSQLLSKYIKWGFVKDLSRGTMLVVGLHFFVMYQVLPSIFFGVKSLREILVLSTLLILAHYIVIRLTYKYIPILYGKWR